MKYKLFQDLDGCLADFHSRIKELTGKYPDEQPTGQMWRAAARDKDNGGFFAKLNWMKDGQELWDYVKKYNPEILTGIPHGKWAAPQKKDWCAKHLGSDVVVHTVWSKDKWQYAANAISHGYKPVIIDDTLKLKEIWVEIGGIFILHTDTTNTIKQLKDLGL